MGANQQLSGLESGFFIQKVSGVGVATGTFINRNHLAGYLEMTIAMGVGLMLADLSRSAATSWRDSARRILATLLGSKARTRLALVIMVTGLVLTHSRMGNTAFFASLVVVGTFYILAVHRISGRTILFFSSLLVIDIVIVGNFFGIDEVAQRLQGTTIENEDRDELARDTLVMIRDFPFTGTGAGSFYAIYPMYTGAPESSGFARHAHNDYLQFASELGLPAALALGAAVLASLWAAVTAQLSRRDRLLQGLGFAATMAVVALLIHSFVDFNLQIPANAATFVVLLALAWICRYWDPLEAAHRGASKRGKHDDER